jgi:hypothetical protein
MAQHGTSSAPHIQIEFTLLDNLTWVALKRCQATVTDLAPLTLFADTSASALEINSIDFEALI